MARADRRRQTRTRADAGFERKYESAYVGTEGLFFTRLRTHAKWVFVFLAVFCLFFNTGPSNTILAGEDPLDLLRKVKHRVVTMHASDINALPAPCLARVHQCCGGRSTKPASAPPGVSVAMSKSSLVARKSPRGW